MPPGNVVPLGAQQIPGGIIDTAYGRGLFLEESAVPVPNLAESSPGLMAPGGICAAGMVSCCMRPAVSELFKVESVFVLLPFPHAASIKTDTPASINMFVTFIIMMFKGEVKSSISGNGPSP